MHEQRNNFIIEENIKDGKCGIHACVKEKNRSSNK